MSPDDWNRDHPIGALVRYSPVLPEHPDAHPRVTRTCSRARLIAGVPLVRVHGVRGGVHLAHVEPLEEPVPWTRKELESFEDGAMLRPSCHVGSGCSCIYRGGRLELLCSYCGGHVAVIRVAISGRTAFA